METSEILKKVRQIEIKTRGLSNNIFAGQYHSLSRVGVCHFRRFVSINLGMTYVI